MLSEVPWDMLESARASGWEMAAELEVPVATFESEETRAQRAQSEKSSIWSAAGRMTR